MRRLDELQQMIAEHGDSDECLEWPYACTPNGYGKVQHKRRVTYVHHIALGLDGRPRPSEELETRHLCGTPSCFNPAHLTWGTPAQNAADKELHGTLQRGETHPRAKLTAEQVLDIRRDVAAGEMQRSVAKRHGVHYATVNDIVHGRRWAHLPLHPSHSQEA